MNNGGHITRTLWCHLRSPPKIHPNAILHFKAFCGCDGQLSPSAVWEVPRTLVRHMLGCIFESAPGISWGGKSDLEFWVTSSHGLEGSWNEQQHELSPDIFLLLACSDLPRHEQAPIVTAARPFCAHDFLLLVNSMLRPRGPENLSP